MIGTPYINYCLNLVTENHIIYYWTLNNGYLLFPDKFKRVVYNESDSCFEGYQEDENKNEYLEYTYPYELFEGCFYKLII